MLDHLSTILRTFKFNLRIAFHLRWLSETPSLGVTYELFVSEAYQAEIIKACDKRVVPDEGVFC